MLAVDCDEWARKGIAEVKMRYHHVQLINMFLDCYYFLLSVFIIIIFLSFMITMIINTKGTRK